MGGEKIPAGAPLYAPCGSPPRGRGKGPCGAACSGPCRITPAWAGKSQRCTRCHAGQKDHPRVGGEKLILLVTTPGREGSPPRGRGKAYEKIQSYRDEGITPAWAGKSMTTPKYPVMDEDHPRVGGEKLIFVHLLDYTTGSPPRGRGKAHELRTLPRAIRITPAWAGKRVTGHRWPRHLVDHPRVGGEKLAPPFANARIGGSPPRGRGKGYLR